MSRREYRPAGNGLSSGARIVDAGAPSGRGWGTAGGPVRSRVDDQAYEGPRSYSPALPFYPWIRTITLNALRMEFRRREVLRAGPAEYLRRLQEARLESDSSGEEAEGRAAAPRVLDRIERDAVRPAMPRRLRAVRGRARRRVPAAGWGWGVAAALAVLLAAAVVLSTGAPSTDPDGGGPALGGLG